MTEALPTGPVLGQRHLQILLLFLSIVVNLIAKYNAGVAVVAMTNADTTNPNFPEYDWNEKERSYILSSFFFGYFVTQFPGGYLCRRFGTKLTMLISTLGNAICVLFPPFLVATGGWQVYCGIRVIQGLFQGLLFPCIHAHLAAWCPVDERNRLGALANTGIECGTLLAAFLSGWISVSSMGWPGIFYISATVGFAWCIIWIIFGANSPSESKFISQEELKYIESSINATKEAHRGEPGKKVPVPWKAIWTSVPFWSLVAVRAAQSWGFSTLQSEIPTYLNGVLKMNMSDNALYSALPYLAMWIMSYVYIIAADVLLSKKIISLTTLRKTFNSLAYWIPAIGLVAIGFIGVEERTLVIVLLTINVGINSGSTIGSSLNTIDLSPNHAGILMGIVNTVANIFPFLTPLLVGLIVENEHDRTEWQIVFIIAAIIFFVGNLFYVVCGRMEPQVWNSENYHLNKREPNEKSYIIDSLPTKAN